MLFTFAGSSHTKYTNFLLETICDLELESSPKLKAAKLDSMLVNLSGLPGHFLAKDFVQEMGNKITAFIAERKGQEYGGTFIREIVSRNLHHFIRLLSTLRDGVGLQKRSGKHPTPHTRPELRKLAQELRTHELHSRRPGRTYDTETTARSVDNYSDGFIRLDKGKLDSWKKETIYLRNVHRSGGGTASTVLSTAGGQADQRSATGSELSAPPTDADIDRIIAETIAEGVTSADDTGASSLAEGVHQLIGSVQVKDGNIVIQDSVQIGGHLLTAFDHLEKHGGLDEYDPYEGEGLGDDGSGDINGIVELERNGPDEVGPGCGIAVDEVDIEK